MEFIEKYNPENAANLTPDEVAAMKDFTNEQIAELAEAYPNVKFGGSYLHYADSTKKETEQVYPLGTWQNLKNLRDLGQKQYSAVGFRKNFVAPQVAASNTTMPSTGRVVDLKADEAGSAEGLKQVGPGNGDALKTDLKADALKAYNEALEALNTAKTEAAHHMTIKSLETKLAEALKACTDLGFNP